MAPTVANRCVTNAVRAPIRAAADAASQPACPPPMTMTSKELMGDPSTPPARHRQDFSGVQHSSRMRIEYALDVSRETAGAGAAAANACAQRNEDKVTLCCSPP